MKWFRKQPKHQHEALFLAIEQQDLDTVDRIGKAQPALLSQTNDFGMTPVLYAVFRHQAAILSHLLSQGATMSVPGNQATPLMVAILEDQVDSTEVLLKHGAPVNQADRFGATPLMYAARAANPDLVHLLLTHQADPNVRDIEGETVLIYAVLANNEVAIRLLLEAGADPKARNFDGLSAIDKAIRPEIRQLLETFPGK